jgi:hypothetical protein
MAIPNFTAERSLYQTSAHYRGTVTFGCAEGTAQLAVKSPQCVADCADSESLCKEDCQELVGSERGKCYKACTTERNDCLDACPDITLPPPPTYPPVGTHTYRSCLSGWAPNTRCSGSWYSTTACEEYCAGVCAGEPEGPFKQFCKSRCVPGPLSTVNCCTTRYECADLSTPVTCTRYWGPCTGTTSPLPLYPDPSAYCVTSPTSGFTRCADNAFEYPLISECDDGTRTHGVDFCVW